MAAVARRLTLAALLAGFGLGPVFGAQLLPPGARVLVDKAGTGHRAIVLKMEAARCFVAYEGEDERFDEWVDTGRVREVRAEVTPNPTPPEKSPSATGTVPELSNTPVPEPLPRTLELPRQPATAVTSGVWLEPLPRKDDKEPLRFSTATLAAPRFKLGAAAGITTAKAPLRAVLLHTKGSAVPRGFAALEGGVALYRADGRGGFTRAGELDTAVFGNFTPEYLQAGDLNDDGETDLVVAAGPLLQVFFGTADGRFVPSAKPYRAPLPLRHPAVGRFFAGALPWGVAVVEGENTFRLLRATADEITATEAPFEVKFERITCLVPGDFDGDGFSDLAVASETAGHPTGAWMFFNQRGVSKPFLWPVGGRDDFARDLAVADLDHDGRDDLIMTDGEVQRGERIRIVYGAPGRAGWEDPWELIGSEYGVGFGTAAVVVGDFNHDGRTDLGIAGRNGLRIYLGADYRRFGRNPVWPRLDGGDFPEHRWFLTGDFNGDGAADLLGCTPAFATGYNIVLGDTPAMVAGVQVPAPLRRRAPTQSSSTVTKINPASFEVIPGAPTIHFLGSRTEPYGQHRLRIVVEVAVVAENVVEAVDAVCKYEDASTPLEQVNPVSKRQGERVWFVEVVLPRGRNYEFTITARDDHGRKADPLRVTVNP